LKDVRRKWRELRAAQQTTDWLHTTVLDYTLFILLSLSCVLLFLFHFKL
jgi:hypothetical protein